MQELVLAIYYMDLHQDLHNVHAGGVVNLCALSKVAF